MVMGNVNTVYKEDIGWRRRKSEFEVEVEENRCTGSITAHAAGCERRFEPLWCRAAPHMLSR
jgi:hypothetical protein